MSPRDWRVHQLTTLCYAINTDVFAQCSLFFEQANQVWKHDAKSEFTEYFHETKRETNHVWSQQQQFSKQPSWIFNIVIEIAREPLSYHLPFVFHKVSTSSGNNNSVGDWLQNRNKYWCREHCSFKYRALNATIVPKQETSAMLT